MGLQRDMKYRVAAGIGLTHFETPVYRDYEAMRRKFDEWVKRYPYLTVTASVQEGSGKWRTHLHHNYSPVALKRWQEAGAPGSMEPKRNPHKSLTLRNMSLVTIRRLPNGAVAVSGRKMAGKSRKRATARKKR
jgi:hypothetical protein